MQQWSAWHFSTVRYSLPSPSLSSRGTRDLLGLHTLADSENETGTLLKRWLRDILALYVIPFLSIPKRSLVPRDDRKNDALTKRNMNVVQSLHKQYHQPKVIPKPEDSLRLAHLADSENDTDTFFFTAMVCVTFLHCMLFPSPFLSSRGTRDLSGLHTFADSKNETGTFFLQQWSA